MSAPAATQDRTDVDSSSAEDVQPEVKQKSVSRRKQQTQRRKQQQQQQQMAPPQQQQMAPPQQEEKKDEGHEYVITSCMCVFLVGERGRANVV